MKKLCQFSLCFGICFFFMNMSVQAEANTLGDLRSEYNALVIKQKENNNKSAEAKAEIAAKQKAILNAEASINQAEADMEQAQADIDESNQKIEELKSEAESVLLYLQQMQGENAYVEYVSGASSVTDLITRIAAVEQVSDHIQKTMKDLDAEVKKNEELKVTLANKKTALEGQIISYKNVIATQSSNLESYDKYALDIDTQVEAAKKKLDSYVKLCQDNLGSTADSVVLTSCTKVPVNGGWLKPLYSGTITSEVGMRWGSYHNALDISGGSPFEGTPIYAAAAGTVSGKIYHYSCGGNMLYIDVIVNGKKYTTYYYHLLNFNVNVGDVVDQNTVIGWAGGYSTSTAHGGYDSCTTGAHLHFGVATGWFNGYINRANVITPPGFPNSYGWRFYSRTQMYG